MRQLEFTHRIFEKRVCDFNEFLVTQTAKHLGLLGDRIQLGECIYFEFKKCVFRFIELVEDDLFMTEGQHEFMLTTFVDVALWNYRTKVY